MFPVSDSIPELAYNHNVYSCGKLTKLITMRVVGIYSVCYNYIGIESQNPLRKRGFSLMQKASEVINTSKKYTNNTNNTSKVNKLTNTNIPVGHSYNYECDQLYEEFKLLCGDSRFRGYYIHAFYVLGKERVIQLASIAMQDNMRFGLLIKQALDQKEA